MSTIINIFQKKNNVLLCGWVGQSEKSIFLVFFSPNSNIPRYVSCLDNIIHDHHLICSHDILFKYKNVFIKYPYDALFKYARQKGSILNHLKYLTNFDNQAQERISNIHKLYDALHDRRGSGQIKGLLGHHQVGRVRK